MEGFYGTNAIHSGIAANRVNPLFLLLLVRSIDVRARLMVVANELIVFTVLLFIDNCFGYVCVCVSCIVAILGVPNLFCIT